MTADARRRAEEALAFMDAALRDEMPPLPTQVKALADAVRALLAEQGAGGADPDPAGTARRARWLRDSAAEAALADDPDEDGPEPLAPPPAPCGGRCEDAIDSRSPCPSCAERLAPPPAPEAPILPVCLECSFASGGHVHVNREDGSQAVVAAALVVGCAPATRDGKEGAE